MILVDYREERSGVVEELQRLNAPLKFDKLDVGDYVIGDIGVERKTCSDFVSSIIDKRLFEQARYMLQAFSRPIIVVEGSITRTLRYRRVGYPQVYGAIAALVEMGLTVLRTDNQAETAYAIYYFYKRQLTRRDKGYLPPAKIRVLKRSRSLEVVQLNLVAMLPGISRELAHRILLYFKTPRRFFKASAAELRRVEGLGSARIAKIVEVLDTIYPPAIGDERSGGSVSGRRGHDSALGER